MKRRTQRSGGGLKPSKRSLLDLLSWLGDDCAPSTRDNFRQIAAGMILGRGRGWISRALRFAVYFGFTKHHSAGYRLFSRAPWCADAAGRAIFELASRWAGDSIEIAVDDTLCRRTGRHVWGAGTHVDPLATIYKNDVRVAGKKAFAWGHSWVVLSLRVCPPWLEGPGFAVPLLARLYRAKRSCPREEYVKRTELAAEMIALFRSWVPKGREVHVAGDREYVCGTVIRALPEGTHLVGPAAMDTRFYAKPPKRKQGQRGRPRKRGRELRSPAEIVAGKRKPWEKIRVRIYSASVDLEVCTQVGLWYTVAPDRLCRMIVVRDPRGRYSPRTLVTTDLDSDVADVVERHSRRWLIEVAFRQAKQHLGLGQAQNGWEKGEGSPMERRRERDRVKGRGHRGRSAVEKTVPFQLIVHAAVIVHGLSAWSRAGGRVRRWAPRWAPKRDRPSFEELLAICRTELAEHAFSAHPPRGRVAKNSPVPLHIGLAAA